jgi:hypothetical protein
MAALQTPGMVCEADRPRAVGRLIELMMFRTNDTNPEFRYRWEPWAWAVADSAISPREVESQIKDVLAASNVRSAGKVFLGRFKRILSGGGLR